MGPTNVALVKLFQADQQLRAAQGRLDAATRDVRLQERRIKDLTEKLKLAQQNLREHQTKQAQLDLEVKSRDAHIEKLRTQQQTAHTHKEYQAFLIEINTAKVDRGKAEDQELAVMQQVETFQSEFKELSTALETEQAKLQTMKSQITEKAGVIQAEIDQLKPAREQVASTVSPKARGAFDRLAERFEGEAMSALSKHDRRREEYVCTACNMDLVTDVYNKLHSRDDLVFCPSCHRILYIPEDLPPETAVKIRKPPKPQPEEQTAAE